MIRCTNTSTSTICDGKYHTKIVDGLVLHSLRMRCFQSRIIIAYSHSTHKLLFFCTMCVCVSILLLFFFEDYNRWWSVQTEWWYKIVQYIYIMIMISNNFHSPLVCIIENNHCVEKLQENYHRKTAHDIRNKDGTNEDMQ